jgi:hypothetical protein
LSAGSSGRIAAEAKWPCILLPSDARLAIESSYKT